MGPSTLESCNQRFGNLSRYYRKVGTELNVHEDVLSVDGEEAYGEVRLVGTPLSSSGGILADTRTQTNSPAMEHVQLLHSPCYGLLICC